MALPQSYELANDSEFRLLTNFTTPPRAGRVTTLEASGQVRVATDDPDGGDVLAWPLNGFHYAVDDVVYLAFAANSPDSAIVIGAKAPLPTLDAGALPEPYVPTDGSDPLTADWDIGEDRRIKAEALRARDGEGLRLEDDAGTLGVFVEDGGDVGIGTDTPQEALDVVRTGASVRINARRTDGATCQMIGGSATGVFGTGTNHDLALFANAAEKARVTTAGLFGLGVSSPQGKIHAHDGTGGLLFVSKTAISNVAQTLIPNGTGDVTGGLVGFFVINDGSGAVVNVFSMLPGDNLDTVVGGYTLRLTLNVNGALTAVRQAGTGTATLVMLAVWM